MIVAARNAVWAVAYPVTKALIAGHGLSPLQPGVTFRSTRLARVHEPQRPVICLAIGTVLEKPRGGARYVVISTRAIVAPLPSLEGSEYVRDSIWPMTVTVHAALFPQHLGGGLVENEVRRPATETVVIWRSESVV